MRQPRNLGGEGDVFTRQRSGRFDVGDASAKQLGLAFAVACAINKFGPPCFDIEITAIRTFVGSENRVDLGAAESVDGRTLPSRRTHVQLIGLPVHSDEVVGQVGQRADRHRAAAHLRARTAICTHNPADQQRAIVKVGAELIKQASHPPIGWHSQSAVDRGARRTRTNQSRVGTCSEQQAQTRDDHRLAGPGLAGHDGQARRKVKHGVVDDTEIADAQFLKHGRMLFG